MTAVGVEKVVRIIRCLDCGHKYRRTSPRTEPIPPCPSCSRPQPQLPDRIAAPAIGTTKGRAVDIAYDIVSHDYQLTNLRDNSREGDTAVILPPAPKPDGPITGSSMMWGGAPLKSGVQLPGAKELLAGASQASAVAKLEGRNPMQMLHSKRPRLQAVPVNKE